jgi:A/G-specific adenine glycosylase
MIAYPEAVNSRPEMLQGHEVLDSSGGRGRQAGVRVTESAVKEVRRRLMQWWRLRGLNYSWRQWTDPWRILLAEILLRKTNAEKVQRLIEDVVSVLHSPQAVLQASEEEIRMLLRPFGMQNRKAAELRGLAQVLVEKHSGRVPDSREELEDLPGVGRYIAGATLAVAYSKAEPAADTNVVRAIVRIFGIAPSRKRPREDPQVWDLLRLLLPKSGAKQLLWALLDLGKKVCRPERPLCGDCPMEQICAHAAQGRLHSRS